MSPLPASEKAKLRSSGKALAKFPSIRVVAATEYFQKQIKDTVFAEQATTLAKEMAALWEARVLSVLESYSAPGRWTPPCVLTEIERMASRRGTAVIITPLDPKKPALGSGDDALDTLFAYFNAHTYGRDNGGMMKDPSKGQAGPGDFAIVQFNPFTWDDDSALLEMARGSYVEDFEPVGMEAPDVLFHELIHALRILQGLVDPQVDQSFWGGYDQIEDYLAIVITNIAISERNPHALLRRNHSRFQKLPPNLSTSKGFLSFPQNPKRLQRCYLQEISLFHNIAGSPYTQSFNPIREYLRPS